MRPNKLPEIGEITIVVPTKITDLGVYVNLIEYNNLEGLIILADLSKSRYRSINKVVSVGKKFPAAVQTIDEKTNNITLSKKYVTEADAKTCEENYKIWKNIFDVMNFFIRKNEKDHSTKIDIELAYDTFVWCLSKDPSAITSLLKSAAKDFDKIYENKLENVDPVWINCFKEVLVLKFKEKEVLLEAILEINCYEIAGVQTIKNALAKGQSIATTEHPFKIKLVKSPFYSLTIRTMNQTTAINTIGNAISIIQSELEANGGKIKIVKMPEIVLDKEFEPDESESDSESDRTDDE